MVMRVETEGGILGYDNLRPMAAMRSIAEGSRRGREKRGCRERRTLLH